MLCILPLAGLVHRTCSAYTIRCRENAAGLAQCPYISAQKRACTPATAVLLPEAAHSRCHWLAGTPWLDRGSGPKQQWQGHLASAYAAAADGCPCQLQCHLEGKHASHPATMFKQSACNACPCSCELVYMMSRFDGQSCQNLHIQPRPSCMIQTAP